MMFTAVPESMKKLESCFKAYDIRGQVPEEIDEDLACRIGHTYADIISGDGDRRARCAPGKSDACRCAHAGLERGRGQGNRYRPVWNRRGLLYFAPQEPRIDKKTASALSFPDWRFNLRNSNTESLLRHDVESRGVQMLYPDIFHFTRA